MAQNRIPWYANGECPLERLIVINSGYTDFDGDWQHRLPRATLRRLRNLQLRAFRRTGRWLAITPGWATDRPYWVQVKMRAAVGKYAADPGRSSHGMVFAGQQTAALDVGNWSWVYANDGGYQTWQEDAGACGFTRLPDGYQQSGEEHHIIDWNPWDDEPEYDNIAPDLSGGAYVPAPDTIKENPRMSVKLWNYAPSNDLVLVDHLNMTMRILSKDRPVERERFEGDPGATTFISGEDWGNYFPYFEYVRTPFIAERVAALVPRSADVDEHAIAAQVAAEIGPLTGSTTPDKAVELVDAAVQRIATAAADEQDRRARERLA